jgi:hypothetical protein
MARFVDGDGKMLGTIIGFAVGVFCFATFAKWGWLMRPAPAPAWVGSLLAGRWACVGHLSSNCALESGHLLSDDIHSDSTYFPELDGVFAISLSRFDQVIASKRVGTPAIS